jgi:hypothetical protein
MRPAYIPSSAKIIAKDHVKIIEEHPETIEPFKTM